MPTCRYKSPHGTLNRLILSDLNKRWTIPPPSEAVYDSFDEGFLLISFEVGAAALRSDPNPMRVFLSYTAVDLRVHADAVSRIVRQIGWMPIDHRYWAASGRPSVEECKGQIGISDALVVMIAHRYGWVPSLEEGGDGEKSITWLEVDSARKLGLPVIAFLLDESAPWPPPMIEGLQDVVAFERLKRFKAELKRSFCGFFSEDPRSIEGPVAVSLQKCLTNMPSRSLAQPRANPNSQHGHEQAFSRLFERCLELRENDELVIVYDESATPFLSALFAATEEHYSSTTFIQFPSIQQLGLAERDGQLPEAMRSALGRSSAVVALLDPDPTAVRSRWSLLSFAISPDRRILHIPGLGSELLDIVLSSDIDLIDREAQALSYELCQAAGLRIVTHDRTGTPHELRIDLNLRPQVHSHVFRKIAPGSWANISLGILELCPAPDGVSGAICINGSAPGLVLEPGEETIFAFTSGKLQIPDNPQTRLDTFLAELSHFASRDQDNPWNTFAEFSLGLNGAIKHSSGDHIIAKSSRGAVGIGIGDNTPQGGTVQSSSRWDFTTRGGSVWFGDVCILCEGRLQMYTGSF